MVRCRVDVQTCAGRPLSTSRGNGATTHRERRVADVVGDVCGKRLRVRDAALGQGRVAADLALDVELTLAMLCGRAHEHTAPQEKGTRARTREKNTLRGLRCRFMR